MKTKTPILESLADKCNCALNKIDKLNLKTHFLEQAKAAFLQGQSLTGFVSHCYPSNRRMARAAYLEVTKSSTSEEELKASRNSWNRNTIHVSQLEFYGGGNTIWVHGPNGATVLRIKGT